MGLTEVENVIPEIPEVLDPLNQLFRFSYLYVLWLKIKLIKNTNILNKPLLQF